MFIFITKIKMKVIIDGNNIKFKQLTFNKDILKE